MAAVHATMCFTVTPLLALHDFVKHLTNIMSVEGSQLLASRRRRGGGVGEAYSMSVIEDMKTGILAKGSSKPFNSEVLESILEQRKCIFAGH